MLIRPAEERDAEACAAIYAPYVRDTTITFETEPPSAAEMAVRIAQAAKSYAWLVLEVGGQVAGYAYGSPHKERAAYRWSCEVSVYLSPDRRRSGGGKALYEALFTRLAERGYRIAVAGMTQPNEPSMGLHRALGFELIGTYRRIGWKHGAWRDVTWMQRTLGLDSDEAPEGPH
ncbi:GNAT family N-acetyltransferase [Amycolatopsis jejuensis]|uniref:GNAT family N-acetyltransferase n=1 Tax=Amycolatopsis jejuensis TaxID=330084 RepID=UPI001B808B3D|nr:GNAT family N-acetyltransferase [Amycolatopsis jejuensis]